MTFPSSNAPSTNSQSRSQAIASNLNQSENTNTDSCLTGQITAVNTRGNQRPETRDQAGNDHEQSGCGRLRWTGPTVVFTSSQLNRTSRVESGDAVIEETADESNEVDPNTHTSTQSREISTQQPVNRVPSESSQAEISQFETIPLDGDGLPSHEASSASSSGHDSKTLM